jgi:hypothetical protein
LQTNEDLLSRCVLLSASLCALVALRSLLLLCLTPLLGTFLAAVLLTSIAVGTDCRLTLAPPTGEPPPSLYQMSTHREPENRIRFLDSLVGICETPKWRCREIHAIAKEGSVCMTGPSILFRATQGYSEQGAMAQLPAPPGPNLALNQAALA